MTDVRRSATSIAVQVRSDGTVHDCELVLADTQVTVAEVLDALDLAHPVAVDDAVVAAPETTLAATVLTPGSRISPVGDSAQPHVAPNGSGDEVVRVAVVGGLNAGASTELAPGLYRIDPAGGGVGWYIEVDSTAADASAQPWSTTAPSIETVRDADFVVACSKPTDPEPGHSHYVHRPPRADLGGTVEAIELSDAPPTVAPPSPLSWATLLAPLPIAVLMAIWFRPIFAIFAAMGPIMAVGRWFESRRRFRRASRNRSQAVDKLQSRVAHAAGIQAEQFARLRWLNQPHVAELWTRTQVRSVRMWERRPSQAGYLHCTVGIGPDTVSAVSVGAALDAEIHGALIGPLQLRNVPHQIDLVANEGLGICGVRADALAVARSVILQLATLHGPADIAIGVLCSPSARADWDWLKWLPQCDLELVGTAARRLSNKGSWANAGKPKSGGTTTDVTKRMSVVVVDDPEADVALLQRSARLADVPIRFVAVSESPTALPAACSSFVAVDGNMVALLTPLNGSAQTVVNSVGITEATATSWARSMRRLVDPETIGTSVAQVGELSLLHLVENPSADDIAIRWAMRDIDAAPIAAVGESGDEIVTVNLATDGPHGLIAGTTGSGKSEFLRTLIFSLALDCPPEQLNFVLVDFKGGGAFDACSELPHVAGLITDLDEALVERAISSLRAELQRRELVFRQLGVSSFEAAVKRSIEPLARLVVVIDEFAALATDYPDMMASIIDLAARGRSLGMHLILATQRPSGVVDQKIRANTNLRIALRVQDGFDSQDVVGVPDAAALNRNAPGQAIVRIGGDPPISMQSAYTGSHRRRSERCDVRELQLFSSTTQDESARQPQETTDRLLERRALIALIANANQDRACDVRPLWSPPLPSRLTWESLVAYPSKEDNLRHGAAIGLADLPEQQTQAPWTWDPGSGGLALYGASAACLGTSLVSIGAALTQATNDKPAHLYVIDGDAGTVQPLANLSSTGAYLKSHETDRVERTIRLFERTLSERRSTAMASTQPLVLLVDNVASVFAAHDELAVAQLTNRLSALARDGAPHGVHLALSARTARDIPHRLAQQLANRLVFALADPTGYLTLGLQSREVVALPPMRAIDLAQRRIVHVVEPPELKKCSARDAGGEDAPHPDDPRPIGAFPSTCHVQDLGPASLVDGVLSVPIGIEGDELGDACLVLQPDEHALVVATNGMGRSTALLALLHQVGKMDEIIADVDVVRIAPRRSPLAQSGLPGVLVATVDELEAVIARGTECVVLVDDARYVDEGIAAALSTLVESPGRVRVIAATSPDYVRSLRAWTTPIRHGGTGILLGGNSADSDLFATRIVPSTHTGVLPGRGHIIVRGSVAPVQIALTEGAANAAA